MIYITATIRLGSDPRAIQTKTNKPMTSGFGFADIEGGEGLPLALICWGSIAEELARYRKGATIRVSGKLQRNHYVNKQTGEEVKQLQIVMDGLQGVKRAGAIQDERHPKKRDESKRRASEQGAIAARDVAKAFDDALSF